MNLKPSDVLFMLGQIFMGAGSAILILNGYKITGYIGILFALVINAFYCFRAGKERQ